MTIVDPNIIEEPCLLRGASSWYRLLRPFRGLDKVARLSASDYKCRVVSNSRFTLPMTFRRANIKVKERTPANGK